MAKPLLRCSGPVSRRDVLRAGTLALGGLTLGPLHRARASNRTSASRSVILFWMWGGPSHLETYDPKPDAPSEYRGPFSPIPTRVPGIDICELFPLQAKLADRFTLVRSVHHQMSAHNDASIECLTGKTPSVPDPTSTAFSEHPDLGMIVSKLRAGQQQGGLGYVGIPRAPFMTRPRYLGAGHAGFAAGDPSAADYRPRDLVLTVGQEQWTQRKNLRSQFDAFRAELDREERGAAVDEHAAHAVEVLSSGRVATAFDLNREHPRLRDRYGRHLWGQSCLLARRLAEAGVGVITVDALAPTLSDRYFSWDDHINPQTRWDLADAMRYRAGFMDQAISALIEDLEQRGTSQDILVVAMGEFGRTPRLVQSSGLIGRDHWPDAQSVLFAGGGLNTGQVIGSTNSRGEYPKSRPLTPQDILATIYHHLGIDPSQTFDDFFGRPVHILSSGQPIAELVRGDFGAA